MPREIPGPNAVVHYLERAVGGMRAHRDHCRAQAQRAAMTNQGARADEYRALAADYDRAAGALASRARRLQEDQEPWA